MKSSHVHSGFRRGVVEATRGSSRDSERGTQAQTKIGMDTRQTDIALRFAALDGSNGKGDRVFFRINFMTTHENEYVSFVRSADNGPLAQRSERSSYKRVVIGSNPIGPTSKTTWTNDVTRFA